MMPPIDPLRLLGLDDFAALDALERSVSREPWTPSQLRDALGASQSAVFGVEQAKRLIGHAVVVRLPFEAELQAIMVAPSARGQGVGARLLDAVIAQARAWHSERLLLEVRVGNASALRLYRRAGFGEDGRRREYYAAPAGGPREDALLMSLPLA